jgi:hypothetical protein
LVFLRDRPAKPCSTRSCLYSKIAAG